MKGVTSIENPITTGALRAGVSASKAVFQYVLEKASLKRFGLSLCAARINLGTGQT